MRLIGKTEQQAIDKLWQQVTGLPLLLLMEAAASAVCRVCRQVLAPGGSILILAGKGQNGGDAFACARRLAAAGLPVTCREMFPSDAKDGRLPHEADLNRRALLGLGMNIGLPRGDDFCALKPGSIIVDGIFGTGLRADRPLPEVVAEAGNRIAEARARGIKVVAIDVPTGLDADNGRLAAGAIQADFTITFVRLKIGLAAAPGRFLAGQVTVDPIGVTDEIVEQALAQAATSIALPPCYQIDRDDILACRPPRPADSHKGLFGKVLLLGGSTGMPGAILLAAEAAARSGAGLTYLGVPESIAAMVLAALPECLLETIPDKPVSQDTIQAQIRRLVGAKTAVAVGPGAGDAVWLAEALPILIGQAENLVLDADALNQLAVHADKYLPLLRDRTGKNGMPAAVLTPHPGEFRRLAPDIELRDRQAAATQLAERTGCVVILKGASTVVAEPGGPLRINPTGHDGLARGGSGDVLCGLLAGLLAQGLSPAVAAMAGVYLHGLAAELAAARLSHRSMLPGDVIACLGDTFRAAGWEADVKFGQGA